MSFSVEAVVHALYRATLNRDPDPGGLRVFCEKLADPAMLGEVADIFYRSEEHSAVPPPPPGLPDHSQFGEYPLLLRRLVAAGRRHGIIVDVGARGRDRSNSYDLLSQFGWKGLLVEANPMLYDEIERDFAGTDFTLVRCAVGAKEGVMPFYIGINDDVSSLRRDAAAGWGDVQGQIDVKVRRLAAILRDHGVPADFDILSLDIEGVDISVLNDLIDTSAYRPQTIVVEASYDFATKTLADVDASPAVQDAYVIVDQTRANLILGLKAAE